MSALLDVKATYVVKYPSAGLEVTISDHTPNEIKAELVGLYAELAPAKIVVTGNVITFEIPSGQKNG